MGTAEAIVHMEGEMQQVETYLGGISRRCNTELLRTSIKNADLLPKKRDSHGP